MIDIKNINPNDLERYKVLAHIALLNHAPKDVTTIIIYFCEKYREKHRYHDNYLPGQKENIPPYLSDKNSNKFEEQKHYPFYPPV